MNIVTRCMGTVGFQRRAGGGHRMGGAAHARASAFAPLAVLLVAMAAAIAMPDAGAQPYGQGDDDLDVALNRLRMGVTSDRGDPEAAVPTYLQLLTRYEAPDQVGRIYAGLAQVFRNAGLHNHADSTAKYAKMALEYPLPTKRKMEVLGYLGGAIQVQHRGVTGDERAVARREAVIPYLEGLKTALDAEVPSEKIPLQAVERVRGSGPEYERLRAENKRLLRENAFAREMNEMVDVRCVLEQQVVSLYSERPWDSKELEALALECLGSEEEAARLVAMVEEVIHGRPAHEH